MKYSEVAKISYGIIDAAYIYLASTLGEYNENGEIELGQLFCKKAEIKVQTIHIQQ